MKNNLSKKIWKEDDMFVAYCPELDVSSCGYTKKEAEKNLIEVIEINKEEMIKICGNQRNLRIK